MSHHPVEIRLREVVENCSMQVQQKIVASEHTDPTSLGLLSAQ